MGVGAAGGIGAALKIFCRAHLHRGINIVFTAMGFNAALQHTALVLTAEG